MKAEFLLRMFDRESEDEHEMVCDWWRAHGAIPVPKAVLPRLGVLSCETPGEVPVAALWLYMDNAFDLNRRLDEFLVGGTLGGGLAGGHASGEMMWRGGPERLTDQGRWVDPTRPYDDRGPGQTITLGGKPRDVSGGLSPDNNQSTTINDGQETLFRGRSDRDDAPDQEGNGRISDAARIYGRSFLHLGISIRAKKIGRGVAARVEPKPDGSIVLEFDGQQLFVDEEKAQKRGIKAEVLSRLTFGEELVHGAHLVVLNSDWEASGRPGRFDEFVKAENRKVFNDIRSTLESLELTLEERTKLEGALAAVYHSYYSPFDQEMNISPAGIFSRIESEGRTVSFVGEFLRQVVQLRRQGEIRETALAVMSRRLGEWVRRAISRIKGTLPEAFEGSYGKEAQQTLRRIEETLDSLEGRSPSPMQKIELNGGDSDSANAFEARASDAKYREIDQQWWKDFAAWREKKLPKEVVFDFGAASDEQVLGGFPEGPIRMHQRVLNVKPEQENHPFPVILLNKPGMSPREAGEFFHQWTVEEVRRGARERMFPLVPHPGGKEQE